MHGNWLLPLVPWRQSIPSQVVLVASVVAHVSRTVTSTTFPLGLLNSSTCWSEKSVTNFHCPAASVLPLDTCRCGTPSMYNCQRLVASYRCVPPASTGTVLFSPTSAVSAGRVKDDR